MHTLIKPHEAKSHNQIAKFQESPNWINSKIVESQNIQIVQNLYFQICTENTFFFQVLCLEWNMPHVSISFWHLGKQENGRWEMNRNRKMEDFYWKYNAFKLLWLFCVKYFLKYSKYVQKYICHILEICHPKSE